MIYVGRIADIHHRIVIQRWDPKRDIVYEWSIRGAYGLDPSSLALVAWHRLPWHGKAMFLLANLPELIRSFCGDWLYRKLTLTFCFAVGIILYYTVRYLIGE